MKNLAIEKGDVQIQNIDTNNCENMCQEEECSKKKTKYFKFSINNMSTYVILCDEHMDGLFRKTPIIGHKGKFPIIKTKRLGSNRCVFYCEWCHRDHTHGYGGGHRASHCMGNYRSEIKGGYILKMDNSK